MEYEINGLRFDDTEIWRTLALAGPGVLECVMQSDLWRQAERDVAVAAEVWANTQH